MVAGAAGGREQLVEECRHNLALFLETVQSGELPTDDAFLVVRARAAQRATQGMPLVTLLAAYAAGGRVAWDALRRAGQGAGAIDELLDAGTAVLRYLDVVAQAVSSSYLDEHLRVAAAAQGAAWALVDAFLAGRPTADAAARAGRRLAPAYAVLVLDVAVPHDRLRRFEDAIGTETGEGTLWRLTAAGANVLVPVAPEEARAWLGAADDVVASLSAAAGAPVRAAVAWGEGADGVKRAGDEAVQVLRLVTGLGRPPGLYRLDDVLLEAALSGSAPGPSARLAAILRPLGPELLATLEAYLVADADRRAAASALHVHPNTLDYRLRRIAELTGRSPSTARGLQVLSAALTVRRAGTEVTEGVSSRYS